MLRYISLLLLLFSNQLFAQNSFVIKGTFKDYNGILYFSYKNLTDSTLVKNGTFTYQGQIDLPVPASLFIADVKPVYFDTFILESGDLTVRIDTSTKQDNGKPICRVNTTVLKGGDTNDLLASFRNTLATKGNAMKNKSVAEKKQFYIKELRDFIRQHPTEIASLILVEQASPGFSQQELASFYEGFDAKVKNGFYGTNLKAAIDKNTKAITQTQIRDFAQADINGNLISINSLRGNFVLIDFWASWCIPCREVNPDLLKIYQKYKSKGFEILGVSLDSDRKSWLSVINHDKLNWLNVSDLKGNKNEVALMFNITKIPDNILIDKEGRVIAKNISPNEVEQIIASVLK
ncbi:Thiol-disulfide isomerase or thioredoxin [Pedobacter steynii]|uniref:Thiol-disulfide isomerase or thioredoxin n=1 Tax=Pedobacter steynii TaxID=430522 RepID=A0A1G9PE45_9SPHI|nr:TlpA disulfide reductase family protein [Pedobacter steynii]NQX39024.1 AhpC/TSA family protein [Pedobacter steynii]SDL96487.1 Thiol-disulfide isomerase or thioredoxin [Pedobacter steynii]